MKNFIDISYTEGTMKWTMRAHNWLKKNKGYALLWTNEGASCKIMHELKVAQKLYRERDSRIVALVGLVEDPEIEKTTPRLDEIFGADTLGSKRGGIRLLNFGTGRVLHLETRHGVDPISGVRFGFD
jgi:hypothetical protein